MSHFSLKDFRQNKDVIFAAFLLTTFIIGVAGALQSPTLSRFLTFEIKASPLFVGLFYSVNAIASIIGSFLLAKYSDRKGDRRNIVIFCCVMGILNSIMFAYTRNFYVLITVGVFFAALTSAAMPQIFALAREYAERTNRNVVAFNSLIRAQLSLAWVIGPPLSFALVVNYGFTTMYLSGATMFLISIIFVAIFLPTVAKNPIPLSKSIEEVAKANQPIFKNRNVVFLFLSTLFMWTANMMYLIDMPLYVDTTLHLPDTLPGHMMGLAAGLEIPIMLMSGFLVPHVGKRNLVFIAIFSGILFYSGILEFSNEVALLALQIFNAIFIGIVANIGIIYFQDLLPTRMGVATTLFNNAVTCGVILAGMLQGIISETYGHHAIYWIALIMLVISFIFTLFVEKTKE